MTTKKIKKSVKKKAGTKKTVAKAAPKKAAGKAKTAKQAAKESGGPPQSDLRVRMYRVGFGDFFLLTVPTKSGPQHILIDCGVHAGDINSMKACVQDLVSVTDRKLALVIATHYHADHLSGFASNFDEFAQFEVGMVWITNRLDPKHKVAAKFKAQIRTLAADLQIKLGARSDPPARQALAKVQNALGIQFGAAKDKEGDNEKALRLLTKGFKNQPPVHYYQGGDDAELPAVLKGTITAEILGPSPLDSGNEFASSDNATEQYLAAAAVNGIQSVASLLPFEKEWPANAGNYPSEIFLAYRTEAEIQRRRPGSPKALERLIEDAQPDVLLAVADKVDGTLNNQSLVILFTCLGKKLLFVGDAQWGNWSYWLYGKKVSGKDPGILPKAKQILESIDFYKVGHHGSTNANPIPAVAALNQNCVSMCSTECNDENPDPVKAKKRPYGDIGKGSEVPRIDLMVALEKQTNNRLVRSDWIAVPTAGASPEAKSQLPSLPPNFSKGDLYVDYVFPK
jgi:beta-lactamase superfamily II metal-dependent hydrolase